MAAEGEPGRLFDRRAFFLGAVQAGAGVALIGRMAQLSIAEADKYKVFPILKIGASYRF